ncbi:YihY/virulence factor BrkB family protein [Candidatus Fokinia crypta]|uniref:Virulence factor BrkB domain protein n=1 Tax=Candidatus Fokinia crypta TaxID=1920990 RepID=A0ABZ0UQI5_9RICK|nr:YhjD/YihY/BrkB family envelope integrity protein [Candidatus Fokinia cryptica]WPX98142.1 Virulence factor BrkB domain protein [Candidatus Fokinia cryptica]
MSLIRAFKVILMIYKVAIRNLLRKNAYEYSGYLVFLVLLGIFPSLIFFTAVSTFIATEYRDLFHVTLDIDELITNSLLSSKAHVFIDGVSNRILEILRTPPESMLTFAMLSAIWSASGLFDGILWYVYMIYGTTQNCHYIRRRIISIVQFMAFSLFLIFSILCFKLIPLILFQCTKFIKLENTLYDILNFIVQIEYYIPAIYVALFGMLSYIHYTFPRQRLKVWQIMPGVINTILFWEIFSEIFGYYIQSAGQLNIIYGSMVGISISILYIYFASLIFLFGLELNGVIYKIRSK